MSFNLIASRYPIAILGAIAVWLFSVPAVAVEIPFSGEATKLQRVIDNAPENATIACDSTRQLVISKTTFIEKAMTLTGLTARLPKSLGRTPMIWIQKSGSTIEACKFYDANKDGIMVTPIDGGGDIVGGSIRGIEAFRMGRDAVSLSGGNNGARVRNVTVDKVKLKVGYLRGAVEVSDGTDSIAADASGSNRIRLNGDPLFQLGPLDQGYWSGGHEHLQNEQSRLCALQYDLGSRVRFEVIARGRQPDRTETDARKWIDFGVGRLRTASKQEIGQVFQTRQTYEPSTRRVGR